MPTAERRSPVRSVARLAVLAATLATGCSTGEAPDAPLSCQATTASLERALGDAPDPVTLRGTPISSCFTRAGDSGEIQSIGFPITEATSNLAREARERPEGESALELGYLVGAVRAGAGRTQGIHDELLRRVEQELAGVDTGSAAFREGERAGRESG